MKRYIRSAQESYQLYRNKRNENKYVEVRKLTDGHTEYRSFLFWDTDRGPVKNYYTSKSNKGRWHRGTQDSLRKILEDYELVESVQDGVKDDFSYEGAPENPNDVVESSVYVQKLIRKRPKRDRNGEPLLYSGSGGRSLVGIHYDSIDKFDSREEAEEDLRKYATKPSEWEVVEYEVEKSSDVMTSTSSWPEESVYAAKSPKSYSYTVEYYKRHGEDPSRDRFDSYESAMDAAERNANIRKYEEIIITFPTVNGPSVVNFWSKNDGWYKAPEHKGTSDKWPEELTYDDYPEGDQIIEVFIDVVGDLNLFEETSAQGGIGTDFFYDDEGGEELARIDLSDEEEQLTDLYYASKSKEDFKNKVRNWMIDLCGLEGRYMKK